MINQTDLIKNEMFKAISHNGASIITVLARTHAEAEIKIKTELTKNWSRRAYYGSWKKGGKAIVDENGAVTRSDGLLRY